MASWGKKLGVRGKNEKGERKKRKITLKKGVKGLKNAYFWAINSKKKFAGGLPSTLHPPPAVANLSVSNNLKRGWGKK